MGDHNYIVGVIDKLGEAGFFLEKLAQTGEFPESSYYASAFGSACYSLIECLKRRSRNPKEAQTWWQRTYELLKANPMHRYFHKIRNEDVHEGEGLVSGIEVEVMLKGDQVSTVTRPTMRDDESYSPAALATECRGYYLLLLKAVTDGYQQFGKNWDPDGDLSETISTLGREIDELHL